MRNQSYLFCALTVLSFSGWTTAVQAAQERFECTLTQRSNRGPVPEKIDVIVDRSRNTVQVQDIFTKQLFPNPVYATIQTASPQKISVRWKLTGLSYKGSETAITGGIVDYKLSIRLDTLRASLSGVTREYYSRAFGEGRCIRLN